jgi:hypothetical protein
VSRPPKTQPVSMQMVQIHVVLDWFTELEANVPAR